MVVLAALSRLCFYAEGSCVVETDYSVIVCQRQLFIDDYGIEKVEHLARTMHRPAKKGAVIRPNVEKGESSLQTRSAPAWDPIGRVYKLWMLTSISDWGGTTYAESEDGLHWTKPILSQYDLNGSAENNIISIDKERNWPDNAIENAVYDPDEKDALRRFKGFLNCFGREPIVSQDGIRWRRLDVPKIPSSDESNLSYDPLNRTFIATLKRGGPHGRSVTLSTSKDFEHWSEPELIFNADDLDQELGRANIDRTFANPSLAHPAYNMPDKYNVDIYNMGLFCYEGIYIGLPSVYHKTGQVDNNWPGFAEWNVSPAMMANYLKSGDWCGFHHVQMICGRDLRNWHRVGDRKPFIDLSPVGAGAYDLACIIGPSFPVVRGDELWFYYTGIKSYGGPPPSAATERDVSAICLAVLRRDGFVSLDAGEKEGVLITKPFSLTGGKLFVNVDAGKGELRAQVLGKDGKTAAVSGPIKGDQLRGEAQWREGALAGLKGQIVRLRFALRNGGLYSYWLEN